MNAKTTDQNKNYFRFRGSSSQLYYVRRETDGYVDCKISCEKFEKL